MANEFELSDEQLSAVTGGSSSKSISISWQPILVFRITLSILTQMFSPSAVAEIQPQRH